MKTKPFLWMIFALATAAQAATLDAPTAPASPLQPQAQEAQAAHLVADVLGRYHYKPVPLDDALSAKIFDRYLKSLDPERLYFVQADIDRLSAVRTKLGDAIVKEDLSAPFAIFNLYAQRVAERYTYARALLKQGFDFSKQETYQYERAKAPWPQSETEARELWRKRVKNDWLRLRLAAKSDKDIVKILDNRYAHSLHQIGLVKSQDVFQSFMDAYTMSIDPHTNYMGPRVAEDFDISMRLSLVGIGAVLSEKDDYTVIRELVPGGPAALSGKLHIGDRIVGVAQGPTGAETDVMGWRLDDTVQLIRGAEDSVVVLDILPAKAGPDGKHESVSLVRKKISLEEQAAKKSVLTVKDGGVTRRIGVITLPAFYEDFAGRQEGKPDFRSATRDVARLLGELKAAKVDAVLVDLRNNGGGSLTEAIDLTGLFIGKGPVVQQRNAKGAVTVANNTRTEKAWDGPLGVLINRSSASASEIFAAAIQDYGRGLIIGEPSFGKGTVQTVLDLDQATRKPDANLGELRFTIAQFFRVNGGTTQLRGVTPDIAFPSAADAADFGEASFDNALPWTQIDAAEYSPAKDLKPLEPTLLARLQAREKTDRGLLCLKDTVAELKRQREKNLVSLNETERRKERDTQEARLASCDTQGDADKRAAPDAGHPATAKDHALRDDGLQPDERSLSAEPAKDKARDEAKDVLLHEAAEILGDEVNLAGRGIRPAPATGSPAVVDDPKAASGGRPGA